MISWHKTRFLIVGACLASCLTAVPLNTHVAAASPEFERALHNPKIGDKIGNVYATDIRAYVNGHLIPSLNIDGYTAVVAEDLRSYGFDVAWTPDQRRVTILPRQDKPTEPIPAASPSEQPIGAKLGNVLYTDIETYYEDQAIPSYNIGGRTAIRLNDLDKLGDLKWEPQKKEISFQAVWKGQGEMKEAPTPLVIYQRQEIKVPAIQVQGVSVVSEGKQVGQVLDGSLRISLAFMAQALGYKPSKANAWGCGQETICFDNGSYGIMVDPRPLKQGGSSPLNASLFWMGGEEGKHELQVTAVDTPLDVLVEEWNLKELFGYSSTWEPETRTLNIVYVDYAVDDFGFPKSLNNYYYTYRATGYLDGSKSLLPSFTVKVNPGALGYGGSMGLIGETGAHRYKGVGGLSEYRYDYEKLYNLGSYEQEIQVSAGMRILFKQNLSYELTMKDVSPVIDYPDPFSGGEISRITFDKPTGGYTRTSGQAVSFHGKALKKASNELKVIVEHQGYGGGFEKVDHFDVPIDGDAFSFEVKPQADPRYLTRVTVQSLISFPRGTRMGDVARFYIEKATEEP
ncbi:hypothetical protein WMW72_32690 [Paenibacillus filicis]|uniref:Copper amine oxidase-like N-terminal domain-containing protein n=1 Tax=Paenibacillus filicis TaxID=669464 RepID=A0ABU9DUV0_9BACL